MAGIYIHIPFCKQACHYCDFHFSTSMRYKNEVVQQLLNEIRLRQSYLQNEIIETIYFGGGTPSLLNEDELKNILLTIRQYFTVSKKAEITLEANPDDLSKEKIKAFTNTSINRLSIGIQSFFDEDLVTMNRSHDATQATQCIDFIRDGGITNFSIDLIFGYPQLSDTKWKSNVEKAMQYAVPHLSCYAMTVEPKTVLAKYIKQKKSPPIDNEQSAKQFEYLMQTAKSNNYNHYEISNYALEGYEAKHNGNYWKSKSYLGIGPSAHSFNGASRQWNISNNALYIQSLQDDKVPFEIETLTDTQRLNEYIMTSLRTIEGMDLNFVSKVFGEF